MTKETNKHWFKCDQCGRRCKADEYYIVGNSYIVLCEACFDEWASDYEDDLLDE